MLNVLLIDDNSGNLFLNGRILKQLGCHVTEMSDPVKALHLVQSSTYFDVIFVDLHMPRMNGIQFLERAQTLSPIVITSVLAHPNMKTLALSKGAAFCMFEEHEYEDFKGVLEKLFSDQRL